MAKWVVAVEGSLKNPPIILRQDRMKLSAFCLIFVVLAAATFWVDPEGPRSDYFFWPILFGLVALLFAWSIVFRDTLTLDPSGLVWRTGFRTRKYEWRDFVGFSVDILGWQKYVAMEFSNNYKKYRRDRLNVGYLGSFWELPVQKIVDVLNEARKRWEIPE